MNKKLLDKLKKLTILYAEDEKNVQKDVAGYLELVFKDVVIASDGSEAYDIFKANRPDLVLTDIDMPVLNGIELAKKIRIDDNETPIIIMTAHTKPEYLIDAVELNITRYLVKPFVGEELLSALEKVIEKRGDGIVEIAGGMAYQKEEKLLLYQEKNIPLTVKESMLLELLLSRKNHVFSTVEMENRIWGDEFVTDSALRALIKNLRKKLPVDCIKNVVGHGYKLTTEE